MKTKKILLFLIALFVAGVSFAQPGTLSAKPLNFSAHTQLSFADPAPKLAPVFLSAGNNCHSAAVFDPQVHYPAFFCRMELKAVKQFGIRIKVHAGDYDRYSRSMR